MTMHPAQPVTILLVEDNLQDLEITQRAFAKGRVRNDVFVVRDGEAALDYLYQRGPYQLPSSAPRPGLILLDLTLPKVGGLEVLQCIKHDEALKAIPVVVLTASQREQDIVNSYALGVNTYIEKPVEFDKFLHVVRAVQNYWIVIATLSPDDTLVRV